MSNRERQLVANEMVHIREQLMAIFRDRRQQLDLIALEGPRTSSDVELCQSMALMIMGDLDAGGVTELYECARGEGGAA